MPRAVQGRTIGGEAELAKTVATLREQRGWTYEEMAERMTAAGCKIHASAVYKTEKEGRRITLDEAIGYAEAFDASSLEQLLSWGRERKQTEAFWRAYLAAERMRGVRDTAVLAYEEEVRSVRLEVAKNRDLRRRIQRRLDQAIAERLQEMKTWHDAPDEGQSWDAWVWEWATPSMRAAKDVLKGDDDV